MRLLDEVQEVLAEIEVWDGAHIQEALGQFVREKGIPKGQLLWPLRIALSGKEVTPGGAHDVADILGKDEALNRLAASKARFTAGDADDAV